MTSFYIGNLSYQIDEAGLAAAFKEQGFELTNVRIIRDRETKQSKGFGFGDVIDKDAARMMEHMDGLLVSDRNLRVALAEPKKPSARANRDATNSAWPSAEDERPRRQRSRRDA